MTTAEPESTSEPESETTPEPKSETSSEPVPEVTSEPEAESTAEAEPESTSEPESETTEPVPEVTSEIEAESTAEASPESTSEPESETTEPEPEVTSEPEAESTAEAEPESTSEPESETTEPEPEVTSEPEAESTAEAELESTSEPESETAEPEPEVTSEPEAESTTEAEPESTSEPESETTEPEPEVTSEPEAESTAEAELESTSEPESETAEPEPEVTSEPEAESTAESSSEYTSEPESESTEPESETAEPVPGVTSEPESEIISEPESETTEPTESESLPEFLPTSESESFFTPTSEIGGSIPEPSSEASPGEIILPPTALVLAGVIALLLIYSKTHRKKILKFITRKHRFSPKEEFPNIEEEIDQPFETFITPRDKKALTSLDSFQNNVKGLFQIAVTPFMALWFCPLTLFLYRPIAGFMWPVEYFATPPDVNSSISCFLVPSGMVYAITFGFAFQQAVENYRFVSERIQKEIITSTEVMYLTKHFKLLPNDKKYRILQILKELLINRTFQIQAMYDQINKVDVWEIVELLHVPSSSTAPMDLIIPQEIVNGTRELHGLFPETGPLYDAMHWFQWVFLETLSYFTFLGVLLIKGQSYRFELAICIVTVVSISLLCFVVSDLDNPYHGLICVDLQSIKEMVYKLQEVSLTLKQNTDSFTELSEETSGESFVS